MQTHFTLAEAKQILVQQVHEMFEWVGFETRNKYRIIDSQGHEIAFAAEQQKGLLNLLFRQWLGHWRKFDVHFFSNDRVIFMIGHHPFRWFFQRLELKDTHGRFLGAIQRRFSILSKRFDVENEHGIVIMEVSSPIWRIWNFTFLSRGRAVAVINKKWSGLFSEALTDRDNFLIDYSDPSLSETSKKLVLAAAIFVDLMFFERKAGSSR